MLRRLFTLASAVSLILCAATVVLWMRSYWAADGWICDSAGKRSSMTIYRGTLEPGDGSERLNDQQPA